MEDWEYISFIIDWHELDKDKPANGYWVGIDEKKTEHPEWGDKISSILNHHGANGYELVNATPEKWRGIEKGTNYTAVSQYRVFFKHRKDAQASRSSG